MHKIKDVKCVNESIKCWGDKKIKLWNVFKFKLLPT